jgi:hypothetical protein
VQLSGNAYCDAGTPVVRLNVNASGAISFDYYRTDGTLVARGITNTSVDNGVNVIKAGQTYQYYVIANNATDSTISKTISVSVPWNVCP